MIFSITNDLPFSLEKRFYKGGGGAAQQVAATPVPQAIRPVTERLSDFSTVSREEKKKQAKRKGIGSTILAGADRGVGIGGAFSNNVGQKTLLGG